MIMETFNMAEIIKDFQKKEISVFTTDDFSRLFGIRRRDTVYKKLDRLRKKGLIARVIKGKYFFTLNPPDDFILANFLYQPSYVSLESAMSFYGIISGFPYRITSVTVKKTKKYAAAGKEYQYTRLGSRWFWGYEKKDKFLIAEPEKAVIDYLYLASKGLRPEEIDEFDFSAVDRKKLEIYLRKAADERLMKMARRLKL